MTKRATLFWLFFLVACSPVTTSPANAIPTVLPTGTTVVVATALPISKPTVTPEPTKTPLPTPTPTFTPMLTETMIPIPTLAKHEWQPKTVLVEMDFWGGDGGNPFSYPPELVLYADGRLILNHYLGANDNFRIQVLTKKLSRQKTCAFLNTIEQTGFFDYDPYSYKPKGSDYFSIDGSNYTAILVDSWRHNGGNFYALWSYANEYHVGASNSENRVGEPPIPLSLKNVFWFLSSYIPNDVEVYVPERVGMVVLKANVAMTRPDGPAKEWPFSKINLDEIQKQTTNDASQFKFYEFNGDLAKRIYDFFGRSYASEGDLVLQNGNSYVVFVRPIFPYEIPSFRGQSTIPDPNVTPPSLILSCYPEDGMFPIPTPTSHP